MFGNLGADNPTGSVRVRRLLSKAKRFQILTRKEQRVLSATLNETLHILGQSEARPLQIQTRQKSNHCESLTLEVPVTWI